jgi:phenylacetate-CoA ligase
MVDSRMIKQHILNIYSKITKKSWETEYTEIKTLIDKEKLHKFQENALRNLLLHAYKNVPYYSRILKENQVIKNGNVDLSKFKNIPILTKEIIRNEKITSKEYSTRKWYYNTSGGSTGEPISFIQDEQYERWFRASTDFYFKDMHGFDLGKAKQIQLWGDYEDLFQGKINLKEKIYNLLANILILNTLTLSEKNLNDYIKTINSYKPDLILGYATSLYELSLYAEKRKLKLFTPKIVVSSAELLRDDMRKKIENVFGMKIYNFYGSREVASLAGECKDGLMHIFSFNNLIEILDENNRPVKDGEEGKIIVTNLHNYSMPLIRYEIGDIAILGPKICSCGNITPSLKKVIGRITDQFVREDGSKFSGLAFTLHFTKDWIKMFQVIQEDFKKIKILIVKKNNANEADMKEIESKLRFLLGTDCKIEWNFVDHIPKTKRGKHMYITSLVKS